ncbi:broad substrate specificity ATP-binding cassette transporter ABCG2-like isoform X1 [Montipora capricornis]|uniref:broad substrate specificity ATP-binding cassette transporter ABCG2-like isoform X1 n=2 Tax=Montipora capricornis TaxID=246305 RepID=UPI0035F198F8
MDQEISSNEKTPLLGTEHPTLENHRTHDVPVYDTKPNGPSPLSRSFSTDSNQFGSTTVISCHNICYSVTTKEKGIKKERQIIKNLSGLVQPGLNAILGPTGSGKTTLLDILAGRKDGKHLSGVVLVNGQKQPENFKCITGYVVQDDVVMGTLTVRENLHFSASLRLSRKLSKRERSKRVEETLSDLGLFHVAESKVGNEFIRGISGGERKRTNIGMELILAPSVLFLDEPTTGLDAATAVSVVQLLQGLGHRGKTVIMSIHQPRYSIFKTFDTISLLSNGEFVYQGPANQAMKYFEDIGFVCEPHNNPADFFMDVINECDAAHGLSNSSETTVVSMGEGHSSTKPPNLPEIFRKSQFAKIVQDSTKPILEEFSASQGSVVVSEGDKITYATSFCSQLVTVSGRAAKNILRNPQTSIVQLIVMIIFALIVGAIYYQLKRDEHGIQNRVGVFFFLVMNTVFGNLSAVELFIEERPTFIHESASGYYRISVYFLAKVFCDLIPLRLVPASIFSVVVYFMTGLDRQVAKFFIFTFTLILTNLCACSVGFFVSACVRTFAIANLLVGLPYVFMMVFGGVLINLYSVLSWLAWIKYISIFRYAIEILEINELHNMHFHCPANSTLCLSNGNQYLSSQGIIVDHLWYNELALAAMTVVLMTFAYIALRLIKKEK